MNDRIGALRRIVDFVFLNKLVERGTGVEEGWTVGKREQCTTFVFLSRKVLFT